MEQNLRAFSAFVVKSVDEERRVFRGWATTPAVDRAGDVIDPMGATFINPVTLLHQHKHDRPIGKATFFKPTPKGIEFEAEIPVVKEEGDFKERCDTAWAEIKYGVVRAVSIGFRAKKYAYRDDGGIDFQETEIYELSPVSVPALPEAIITSVKSMSAEPLSQDIINTIKSINPLLNASHGNEQAGINNKKKSGVSEPVKICKFNMEKTNMKTIQEQITDAQSTLDQKKSALLGLVTKSSGGQTFTPDEKEAFDTLDAEVSELEEHIKRLNVAKAHDISTAKPVDNTPEGKKTNSSTPTRSVIVATNDTKLEKGIAFARVAKCLALGHLEHRNAVDIAKHLYGDNESIVKATEMMFTKAAVPFATTTDSTYASPLIGTEPLADFVEYLRPQTIIGQVPNLRNIGFRLPIVGQTSGGSGYWVGEGGAKPLTKFDFNKTQLDPLKVANIAVASMEVIRDSRPSADFILRDQLAAALRERLDIDFIDPTKSAVVGISPASILNGVAGIPSSGTDATAIRTDVQALFRAFIQANNAPTSGVWIMDAVTALALGMMQNPLGQAEFPGIGMNGGTFQGFPVVVSQYVPRDSSGGIVALINASDIYIGDEGGIEIAMSTEASLQMSDTPDDVPTASTVTLNLWQHNLVAFRAERAINWARRRASAVAYLTGVNWGA